jgi:hypothetical protein
MATVPPAASDEVTVASDTGLQPTWRPSLDRILRVALVVGQLAGVTVAVRVFEIESGAFRTVLALAVAGFAVHVWLPVRHRLWFFAVLSMISPLVVLGAEAGGAVLFAGVLMIGFCHLPLSFRARVALVLLAAGVLAVARAGGVSTGIPGAVWPVLASMFMFRLGLYLHALRHDEATVSPPLTLSYFFMLPNACFPLFPVVDYRAFARSRADAGEFVGLDRGVRWIVRGLVHLLLYRLVYAELAPREFFVYGLGDLVRQVLSVVLLYLRVSGQFHIIVGILHLFGFRLHETHHLYLLATGFIDYWRRINIYWRDFLMKIVYYPVFLGLRGQATALRAVVATVAVFGASWFLHSYQYFWISGRPLLSVQDLAFWAVFALLVAGAVLRELGRAPVAIDRPPRWNARRAVATVTTFAVIAVLWSWWSAESAESWLFMWKQARYSTAGDWLFIGALLSAGLIVGGRAWGAPTRSDRLAPTPTLRVATWTAFRRLSMVSGLCALLLPGPGRLLPGKVRQYLHDLRGRGASTQHDLARIPGYYEALTRIARSDAEADMNAVADSVYVGRDDFLMAHLRPSFHSTFRGQRFRTNSAGLRDDEYSLVKPPGTFRIALLGPSDVMGSGVHDEEVFESLLEARLDSLARGEGSRIEVLNFGFSAWSLPQRVLALRELAAPFAPDLVLLAVNPHELVLLQMAIATALARRVPLPDTALASLVKRGRVDAGMTQRALLAKLRPLERHLYEWTITWAQQESDRVGARLALLTLSFPMASFSGILPTLKQLARDAGLPVVDCAGIWRRLDGAALSFNAYDGHPNAEGHRLIADCLYDRLTMSRGLLPLRRPAS